jgi:uncharacterized protein DUF2786
VRDLEEITGLLLNAGTGLRLTEPVIAQLTGPEFAEDRRRVDTAADVVLVEVVSSLLRRGWQPYDIYRMALRRAKEKAVSLAVDAIAAEVAQRPATTVQSRWREQLAQIGSTVWWRPDQPRLSQWAARQEVSQAQALAEAVDALAALVMLPTLPDLPVPQGSRAGLDEKKLARVRALLAKAESTPYPEEAEALSAKAQELMSRYSFEQALVDPQRRRQGWARRFWLDDPYVSAKMSLVSAVALANRCRAASYKRLAFVTLVGHEVDLDHVELLATSLLVQATEAMLAAGRATGSGRPRSFRHSFLLAYAERIGERLCSADRTSSAQVTDARLLPALARRKAEVDELFGQMFPNVGKWAYSIGNNDGWYAGRAAADRARLGVDRLALEGRV